LLAGRDTLIVVEMQVPDEELVRRVQGRRVCKSCGTNVSAFGGDGATIGRCQKCGGELVTRSDDNTNVVRERLKIYWRDTRPVIDYYNGRPTFRAIDGAQSPEQVRQMLVTTITSLAASAGVVVPPAGPAPTARPGARA
jgi:adenylate kinase